MTDNYFTNHKLKGGEYMKSRQPVKFWTQEEMDTALDMANEGKSEDEIASVVGRTPMGIKTMIYHFDMYRQGKGLKRLSKPWLRQFSHYLKSNKNVAESLREEVQEGSPITPSNTDTKLEALLQTVETNWNRTLQAVSNLVEYEVSRRTTEERAKNENELRELREFKEQAKDSNIAGTLRKSLMSFRG